MNAKFFDLKKEKQDRMINAALKCFALCGYKHASTDEMVKEAAISKGLLFHYFGSKQGVYRFVYDYSVRYINLDLRMYVDARETNLFEVVKQIERAKLHVMKEYPYMQQFLNASAKEDAAEVVDFIAEKKTALEDTYRTIYERIDYSCLPEGIPSEKVTRMIDFTIKGLMSEAVGRDDFRVEEVHREICEYLDLYKQLFA